MIITVGGLPGSGTTTLAAKLCDQFGMTHVYAGKIFRDMASERGLTLEELSKEAEKDEKIDLEIDRRQKERAVNNTVVEGRMTAFLIDANLKIWLFAPLKVRAERVSVRDGVSVEEAVAKIEEREASERKRYKKYYSVDIENLSVYDLVMNTRLWDHEGVFQIVRTAIEVREW